MSDILYGVVIIVFVAFVLLVGAGAGYRVGTEKVAVASFDEQWKCTRSVPYYPKGKIERICNQWTRIK